MVKRMPMVVKFHGGSNWEKLSLKRLLGEAGRNNKERRKRLNNTGFGYSTENKDEQDSSLALDGETE